MKEVPANIKQNLSNVKSVLRGKMKLRKQRKAATAGSGQEGHGVTRRRRRANWLTWIGSKLRLTTPCRLARQLTGEEMDDVIKMLRVARNRVIIRIGEQ